MKEFCLLYNLLPLIIAVEAVSEIVTSPLATTIVTPKEQTVKENEDAIIDCLIHGKTYWKRKNNKPLPKQSVQVGTRLYINRIKLSNSGYYQCYDEFGRFLGEASVKVVKRANERTPEIPFTTIGFQENYPVTTTTPFHFNLGFTFQTFFSNPVTHYPCLYGLCNGTCCVGTGVESFFDCANGQKINKSLVCNQQNDCTDGSDEAKCSPWPPKITLLPEPKVEVFCGDQDKSKAGILVLECRSVGHPMPLIKWKKYEGHVPSKCVQSSRGGLGRLECPNFQQSDQGAYSCVAENLLKSAESQPKSVAKCSNVINCKGFKVVNEHQIEHCLECFCSGKTSLCQGIKSKLEVHKFSFPETKTEVFANDNGEVVFVPTKHLQVPDSKVRESAKEIAYCFVPEENLKEVSFLKSFGRNLIIPRFTGKREFLPQAPDVIIQGNGLSLIYTFNRIFPSGNSSGVAIRFWPGNWHHIDKKIATRADLMKVLSGLDSLLLRCEYVRGEVLNLSKNTIITLETSVIKNFTNSVSYVEKCNCPVGYDGLSCELCAEGYTKKIQGNDFVCEKIYVPPKSCKQGYVGTDCTDCDEKNGYVKQENNCVKFTCDPIGSLYPKPNLFGECTCRVGVTGELCEKCKNDHFYLQKDKGCSKCWCSGITDQCASSKLFRTVISKTPYGGYNSSDGRNFWLLPSDFSGNRLTSYGGFLNYTMKYKPGIPKEKTFLTVEFLSLDDETLVYTHPNIDKSLLPSEKSWSVPITEEKWRKSDKSLITRGEFLSVLSKIKAIYIESPYHLSSGQANLTLTRMTSATPYGDDDSELALAVEQCHCPVGYSGLSCESCSEGYYKKRNGSITQCLKCNCSYCDPELGCPDCPGMTYRDNPEYEKMPVCKPCPCNNNALACSKDDYNQVICRCKPGFTGMHCEKIMPSVSDHDLTLRISPRRIRNKKVGSELSFNCSYSSKESMSLSAQKTFAENHANSILSPTIDAENETLENDWTVKNYKIVLEGGLQFVECFLHDTEGKLAGHIRTVVEDLITIVKPVKITKCHETVIKLKESESKELICEATGSPPPMITWYKSRMNEAAEKVDTVEGIHSIQSATLEQNGTVYTCVAENSEGDKATCPVVLIVTKKCEIVTIEPPKVEEEEGRNISISCRTSAKSNVTWSRLHLPHSMRTSFENEYLKIYNVTVSDSGTYICEAMGHDNNTINSTVDVTIHERRIPPSVEIPDDDKILHVDDVFEVKCIGYGKPFPHITWRKKNNKMDTNVFVRRNVLTITKATVQNTGIYVCEGSSILGNATAYISIEVKQSTIPPTVVLSQENIKSHAGEEVTLTCTAKGFPQPEVNWLTPGLNGSHFSRKQDGSESTDTLKVVADTITFKVTQDMDGKSLICQAESLNNSVAAAIKITVLQPKIAINERSEFARLGSYFVLQCGSIHDNVTWHKIGGLLGDECKVLNRLTFESVQVQHNGTYICETESNSKHIINLIVTGFVPKFSQDRSSYLVLPTHLKSPLGLRIEMAFNPTKENGLLLHRENHLLDLYLKGKKIHLGVYTEEGDFFDIVMKEPLQLRKWYSLIVTINSQYIDITVYDQQMSIYGRKTENSESLKINIGSGKETFFIGGAKSSMNMRHPHKLFLTHFRSFDGCISRLTIDRHEFDLVRESSYSEKVHLCNKCLDEPNICGEKGKCLDAPTQYGFICVCNEESEKSRCRAGCTGKGCETQLDLCKLLLPCSSKVVHTCSNKMYRLECNCAYGYSGVTCDRAVEYSFCSNGDGYIRLPNLFKRHLIDEPETIRMEFQMNKLDGILLWQGNKRNYLSISVEHGSVKYIYHNQNTELRVISTDRLPLQTKVNLFIKRMNNTAFMSLTHSSGTKNYKNHTRFTTNRVFGDIYLGNAPEAVDNNAGLDGCIYYIFFGDKNKIDLRENQLERINIFLPEDSLSYSEEYDSNSDENNVVD